MLKRDVKIINVRIDADVYEKLVRMQSKEFPSVSHIIRDLIRIAISTSRVVKPIELKPLENLVNPVTQNVESKKPLEIPIPEITPVLESEPLIPHTSGRKKVNPELYVIMKARRARDAGREYDKSLDQHFHLLDELK